MREIRSRIKSVKSTQQITRAMKMVSVAKLRRTQSGMESMRVFSEKCRGILSELLSGGAGYDNPFLTPRQEIRRVCYVLFLGNRGLCGVYNSALVRYAQELLQREERSTTLVTVGRWGRETLQQAGLSAERSFAGFSDVPTAEEALELSEYLKRQYLDGGADEIHLLYQHYRSVLTQTPADMRLLPAEPALGSAGGSYIFEPSADVVLDNAVELYLNNTVFSVMLEARVGEHAARMTAMNAASDATVELIGDLSLELNRARQTAITTEIAEIVGGANALKKKKGEA